MLRVEDVRFVRDHRALLDDVSLTVHEGEHWALLGANGAGKSTLLSLVGAYQHPTSGQVEVLGHRLGRIDVRELRAWIGHVNPHHPLRSARTVHEVVLTGATGSIELVPHWKPAPEQLDRAEELIDLLGLAARRDARWPTLSHGERGRTLIARALMPRPSLLLLDEPATGLDVAAREQLLTSIDQLRRAQPSLTSVLVTHHLEELPASTTHAILLRGGRVLASGPADGVLTTDLISACFDHPITIDRSGGRWTARAV
ncbi:ATP-binding cassette domain-containing protein [Actinoallomurus acanthiterrae]